MHTLKTDHSPSYSDWDQGNLIANGDFSRGSDAQLPEGWEAACPNKALAPSFERVRNPDGTASLRGRGNSRPECFGYLRCPVHLAGGKTYRLRVRLRHEGLDDLNRHLVHGVFADKPESFNDGIFAYRKEGPWAIGDRRFPGPDQDTDDAEVRLYFRFSPNGAVWWDRVSLQECEPIPPRPLKIACSWGRNTVDAWGEWLDEAGRKGTDVALLPEMFDDVPPAQAKTMDGPAARFLAQKAAQWHLYTCGSFYERRGDLVLNSAPLFGRDGQLVGIYSKNQLYDPEEDDGVTPGVGFPVFRTDFGRVGIIICYDSWFPETTRLLAYRGADLVLFPNAGYFTGLMPARAADNGVWIAVSSLNCPAGVWDPAGACAGELDANPTRYAPSSVLAFERDERHRMLIATVDLSRRYSPAWWGGPMRSAPGGRRLRQTLITPIEEQIAREAERWWEDPPGET
jgi:predicted amidohydrolase